MTPTGRADTTNQLASLGVRMADTVSQATTTWDWLRSIRQTDSLQLMNTNLNSLAIIATFLAAVQAQAISFSLNNNHTNLQIAANALFFAGLFADVLSGSIAIVGAVQLQRTYSLVQQRQSSLANLSDALKSPEGREQGNLALVNHLRFLEMVIFPLLRSPRLWNTLSAPLRHSAQLVECIIKGESLTAALYPLADYRHSTNRLAKCRVGTSLGFAASVTVPPLVLAGLACFAVGAICLVLDSQPIAVWVASFAVLGGTLILLLAVLAFVGGIDRPIALPFHDA
ncbi:hypothetical protein C8R44DRAFT_423537 [Mycena epipterygia]|nr:hypothetical protein C8R44DRAFT_423537 [Mycena epipterygia]